MKVFTDEWTRKIEARYEQLPEHKRPFIYFVATSEKLQSLRLEIEDGVASLAPAAQKSVISKLRSIGNFTHTYHELVVGKLLRQLGYTIEYEPNIDGLTPDWYVQAKGEIPAFVFEVFTANISAARAAKLREIGNLWGWLRAIPVTGFALDISLNQGEIKCDDKRGKELAHQVQKWLVNGKPTIGARLEFDDISFQVIHYNPAYTSLQLIGPASSLWVNKEPVRINFKEKIHKYRKVLDHQEIPLVVGVVAEFMTGVSFNSFIDLLFGSEAISYLQNEASGQVKNQRLIRLNDGLFHREPSLSVAAWVEKEFNSEWQMKGIHNPKALHELPATALSNDGVKLQ